MARILLVEDDASTLRATALFISDLGHEVEKVDSLRDAQEATAFGKFDLLVVDLRLPDGSGEDLLALGTPAIVLSGYLDPAQSRLRSGQVEYLCKPAEPAMLAATIKRLCT